jgi:hypothetical protein
MSSFFDRPISDFVGSKRKPGTAATEERRPSFVDGSRVKPVPVSSVLRLIIWGMLGIVILAALAGVIEPPSEHQFEPTTRSYVSGDTVALHGKAGYIVVWKSTQALHDGSAILSAASENAFLAQPYMACAVKPGTKAIVLQTGFFSSSVKIKEGPELGCTGVVAAEHVQDGP